MANLSGMSVEALMDLRERVEGLLSERHAELQEQLERMGRAIAVVGGRGASALKGRKVHRDIEVRQAKLGQAVVQNLVGLLLRSNVARNSRIS